MTKEELREQIEFKMRRLVQQELVQIQGRIFGDADLLILSAMGIDGSKKLAEILVEEANNNLEQIKQA